MYQGHFGIKKKPFSIAPDPHFLYMSDGHREALAHLRYGLENEGGFVLLTGDVGTGKTTVCRCLLEQVPQDTDVAFIFNPKVTVEELLATICEELDGTPPTATSVKGYVDRITTHLLKAHAAGRHTVLIIDEAQNLAVDVLEQIRLLTNLETDSQKLLQIILLGQPELQEKLNKKELYQLSQRISARHHLGPLNKKETIAYIHHRLSVAGLAQNLFTKGGCDKLFRLSGGVPRIINMIADRALLGAFAEDKKGVDPALVVRAAKEVFGESRPARWSLFPWSRRSILTVTICVASLIVALIYLRPATDALSEKKVEPLSQAAFRSVVAEDSEDLKVVSQRLERETPMWPTAEEARRSEVEAFRHLFQLWGVTYGPGQEWPCQFAETKGLYCFAEQKSIADLSRLNRPAVLLMLNEQGEEFSLLLRGLHEATATITLGEEVRDISTDILAPLWTGRCTLLWRPPPRYEGSIRIGNKGEAVQWLAEKMAQIFDRDVQGDVSTEGYGGELVRLVKQFQFAHHLVSDGIAGKETLIMVNSKTADDIPLLHR